MAQFLALTVLGHLCQHITYHPASTNLKRLKLLLLNRTSRLYFCVDDSPLIIPLNNPSALYSSMHMFFLILLLLNSNTHTHLLYLPEPSLCYKQTPLSSLVFTEKSPHFLDLSKMWHFSVTLLPYSPWRQKLPTLPHPAVLTLGRAMGQRAQLMISWLSRA